MSGVKGPHGRNQADAISSPAHVVAQVREIGGAAQKGRRWRHGAKAIVIRRRLDNVPPLEKSPRKAPASMSSRFPLRSTLCVAPAFIALILAACGGRGPLDTDIAAYDAPDAAGLVRPGDDGVEPTGDSGAKPMKPVDAGTGTRDAGGPGQPGLPGVPGFPGLPGLGADAGGI